MCSASKEKCRKKSNKCIPWHRITCYLSQQTDRCGRGMGRRGIFWLCFINKSLFLNPEDIFSDRYIYVTLLACYHVPGKFVLLFIPVKIMVSSSISSLALALHCWTNPLFPCHFSSEQWPLSSGKLTSLLHLTFIYALLVFFRKAHELVVPLALLLRYNFKSADYCSNSFLGADIKQPMVPQCCREIKMMLIHSGAKVIIRWRLKGQSSVQCIQGFS